MRKQAVCITLEPEVESYLRSLAEKNHCTLSQVVRSLLWSIYEIDEFSNEEEARKIVERYKRG